MKENQVRAGQAGQENTDKQKKRKRKKKAVANLLHHELGLMKVTLTFPWQVSHNSSLLFKRPQGG